ncbi:MAG: glycosyltransferase family 1 protein, partial [Terrimicrobiaceae bacterium]
MLTIFTIVLNGEPFISKKLEAYQKLTIPWQWKIVEGVSNPRNCTRWCREVPGKWHKDFVSIDGTHEYLKNLKHPKASFQYQNKPFDGKIEMIQRALEGVESGVVMEQDADEFWTEKQME